MDLSTWAPLFEDNGEPHVALVYRDPTFLAQAVARWSAPALRAGGGAILVGTAAHGVLIRQEMPALGIDVEGAERSGRLVFVEADWLMGHFMLDGSPNAERFRGLAREIIHGARARCHGRFPPIRAWGEMVSLLRLRGNAAAAQRLETLWTEVIAAEDIALLCSYDAEHGASGEEEALKSFARTHGHVIVQPETDLAEPIAS